MPYEPPRRDDFIREWLKNDKLKSRIIINPHVSYYSVQSYEECRIKASKNAKRILMGKNQSTLFIITKIVLKAYFLVKLFQCIFYDFNWIINIATVQITKFI